MFPFTHPSEKKTQNSFVLRKKILFQRFCGVHFSWPRPWFIFHTMTLDRVVLPGRRSWTTTPHRATGKYDMYDDFILQSNNHVNFPCSEVNQVNQVILGNNKRELAIASAWCTRFMHQWYPSNCFIVGWLFYIYIYNYIYGFIPHEISPSYPHNDWFSKTVMSAFKMFKWLTPSLLR